jgi:site-specific recombinase XerD
LEFFDWLQARGVTQLVAIESVHVAAYIEQPQKARSAPTAKLRLAALRHLFDWMVIGQSQAIDFASLPRKQEKVSARAQCVADEPVSGEPVSGTNSLLYAG